MGALNRTIFSDWRVLTIVVTDTATTVAALLATALAALGKSMPSNGQPVQIVLTPTSDITVQDSDWDSAVAMGGGGVWTLPFANALERVKLTCASGTVNCVLELYFVPKLPS